MASTYLWSDVISQVAPFIKSIPTSTLDTIVVDRLNSYIWRKYPWRWAIASLTSNSGVLSLVDGVQDYAVGTTTGAGFYQLIRARLTRTDTTPFIAREKDVTNYLAPCLDMQGGIDSIQAISYQPESGSQVLRLDRAASVPSGTTYQIDGEYWFHPVKVTTSATTIVFPDEYIDVAIEGTKWMYYQLGDDSREPTQRAVFLGLLGEMVSQEDWGNAAGTRFPEMGLGVTRAGNPGLFGWLG